MFLGRVNELQYLEQFYQKDESNIVVLYGQKNIGKTALASIFAEYKDKDYYLARPCSEEEQLKQWLREKGKSEDAAKSFHELFHLIFGKSSSKKVIIVDEFHRIVKSSPSFMKDLIAFLSEGNEKYFVILLSSSIEFVENSLVSRIGESALKISGFLKLKELSFSDLRIYFPEYDMDQCVQLFSVLGGYPGLWKYINRQKNVRENLCSLFYAENAPIKLESEAYISRELRETGVYHTLLAAIAAGKNKLNELHIHTGFSRAKISVYLKNLMELELVEKIFSCECEGSENTKKGIYGISLPVVYFYFKYLYPNFSNMTLEPTFTYFSQHVLADFRTFAGRAFEQMCFEHIQGLNAKGELPVRTNRFEKWVGKEGKLDIVAKGEDGKVLLGKCCYEKARMTYEDYLEVLTCAKKTKLQADYIYLYSMEKFDEKLYLESKMKRNITLITMKDS